jgi:hypothetical protein
MATSEPTPARPSFKPLPEHDTLNVAYLLWKIASNLRVSPSGCWEWQGARVQTGYGRVGTNRKDKLVHRLLYELCMAALPASTNVCHHCDNPPCCRLDHLFAGTQSENLKDAVAKGRNYVPCPKGRRRTCKLTPDAVRAIRRRADAGGKGIIRGLAQEYGVSPTLVSQVIHRQRYGRVPDDPGLGAADG